MGEDTTKLDDMLEKMSALEREVAGLSRRLDALRVEIGRVAESGVRFGRDLEMRERGYL